MSVNVWRGSLLALPATHSPFVLFVCVFGHDAI